MKPRTKSRILLGVTIGYVCLTFLLSSFAGATKIPVILFKFHRFDLIVHAIEYGILALFIFRYFVSLGLLSRRWIIWIGPIIISTLIGASNEIFQIFIQGRFAQISDAVANMIGAIVFIGWMRLKWHRKIILFPPQQSARE